MPTDKSQPNPRLLKKIEQLLDQLDNKSAERFIPVRPGDRPEYARRPAGGWYRAR